MKLKPILTLLIFLLICYACKKEKSTPLSLLTTKNWKPTKSIGPDPSKISVFSDCELGDIYTFNANSLNIQQNQPNCSNRQFKNSSNFNYTLDFNSNTIKAEDGTYYYITNLTADTLIMHQIGSYGTTTVKFQYIFIH